MEVRSYKQILMIVSMHMEYKKCTMWTMLFFAEIMKYCLVSKGASVKSWGEGASLALVGHPSSNGVTIKMPYGVDVLHQPALHPIFSYWVG